MERKKWLILIGIFVTLFSIVGIIVKDSFAASSTYKILAWNDLGMHCYSKDFADLAVLPPYNTLWVQVVKTGDPPQLVTSGITVEYSYPDNTYSVGKTNFWSYDQALFGVDLPANVGLKGKGLSGTMDLSGDHFVAEGIPITEYSDSAPTVRQPYQLANVVVKDSTTGAVLTSIQVVTPTSSEMRCDNCHADTGIAKPFTLTGKVETNILQLHDENTGTTLMANRPVLCASCHASNALGAPGQSGIKNLSKSMHTQHAGVIPGTLAGCYNCHPGPQTRCLRDVMSTEEGMICSSCHGSMANVSNNTNPWLNEPRCDACHNSGQYNQNQALYRFSQGHGGLYCEACHDSTHAIAPSREANDAIKFNQLQGQNGPIEQCSVCHTQTPSRGGPHTTVVPRVISITRLDSSPTQASTVKFKISFSKSVTGVDGHDFALSTTGVTGTAITNVSGSGSTYTVTVNSGSGNGTIRLDVIDDDSIKDAANIPLGGVGTGNGSYSSGEFYTIDKSWIFGDVPNTYWAWNSIERLYNAGITGGCNSAPLMYCPEATVTRAQMAIFLLRGIHGSSYSPPDVAGSTGFSDVAPDYWAAAWIKQLAAERITGGCGNGRYCPESTVTRDQMAVFLLRSKYGSLYSPPAVVNDTGFVDVPVNHWAAAWIKQLVTEGITSGCGSSKYCPGGPVSRAQMAVFLVRTFSIP